MVLLPAASRGPFWAIWTQGQAGGLTQHSQFHHQFRAKAAAAWGPIQLNRQIVPRLALVVGSLSSLGRLTWCLLQCLFSIRNTFSQAILSIGVPESPFYAATLMLVVLLAVFTVLVQQLLWLLLLLLETLCNLWEPLWILNDAVVGNKCQKRKKRHAILFPSFLHLGAQLLSAQSFYGFASRACEILASFINSHASFSRTTAGKAQVCFKNGGGREVPPRALLGNGSF